MHVNEGRIRNLIPLREIKGCLHGRRPSLLVGLALFAEIPRLVFVKIGFRLFKRRASPPWRDLAIDYRDLA